LLHDGQVWMSVTPVEIESQGLGVRLARGNVLIFGLGLGWAAAAAAMLPGVDRVTVVERDPDVLALHADCDIFGQLPEAARSRLALVEGDAFDWRPDRPVDLLLADIWLPFVEGDRFAEVKAMQANVGAAAIHFWGQELEIARHAVAAGRALDSAGIAATVAETGLPLAGTDSPDYPAKLEAAARRWMRGRWLEGSATPW
jgi:spermidine synthase